jgi:hypothetical protein
LLGFLTGASMEISFKINRLVFSLRLACALMFVTGWMLEQ